VAPDGSGRPDCMDLRVGSEAPRLLRRPAVMSRRSMAIAGLLTAALLYVILDIFVEGPLTSLDVAVEKWDGESSIPWLNQAAWAYDKVGQRSVLVPVLLIVAGVLARRHRTWRPVVLAGVSFLILNLVVGAMKVIIGRSETETGDPSVLNGGVIFPSGHSSNVVLTGGLIVYLLVRYTQHPPVRRLIALVSVMTTLTILTSIYIGSHWVSDLIGGALAGGLLLQAVIVFDRQSADVRTHPSSRALAIRLRAMTGQTARVGTLPITPRRVEGLLGEAEEHSTPPPSDPCTMMTE
jgi:membrane-associated phospholipid phosphatase